MTFCQPRQDDGTTIAKKLDVSENTAFIDYTLFF